MKIIYLVEGIEFIFKDTEDLLSYIADISGLLVSDLEDMKVKTFNRLVDKVFKDIVKDEGLYIDDSIPKPSKELSQIKEYLSKYDDKDLKTHAEKIRDIIKPADVSKYFGIKII